MDRVQRKVYKKFYFLLKTIHKFFFFQLELRDESQRYRTYLEQRKLDEKRQQIELDRIVKAELDRQNAKRLEKVRAEKDKRAKLLHEVVEGRQQQLVERSII